MPRLVFDRVRAGDLASVVRKPWLRNRISRCYFGPIKRAPFFTDELMNDIDYYPEAYLDRLAHEGVNGLWLTVSFADLAKTDYFPVSPTRERRLAKLRRTVETCARYGIKTWLFFIEPKVLPEDDAFFRAHPEAKGGTAVAENGVLTVTGGTWDRAKAHQTRTFADLFSRENLIVNIQRGDKLVLRSTDTVLNDNMYKFRNVDGTAVSQSLGKAVVNEKFPDGMDVGDYRIPRLTMTVTNNLVVNGEVLDLYNFNIVTGVHEAAKEP